MTLKMSWGRKFLQGISTIVALCVSLGSVYEE